MTAPTCSRPVRGRSELGFDRDALSLDYSLRQYLWSANDPERFVQHWHVQAEGRGVVAGDASEATFEVARADLVRVDLDGIDGAGGTSAFDLLDAESADLATVALHVFDTEWAQLRDDLEDAFVDAGGTGILILDQVWVAPPCRGHEIGPLVAACALEALGTGCGLAFCFPSPFEDRPDDAAELAKAVARLGRVWAKVGFEPYRDTGVHVLHLGTGALARCLARLSRAREAI